MKDPKPTGMVNGDVVAERMQGRGGARVVE